MKKGHLLILSLLVIPFGVLAANPKVLTLTGEAKDNTINYSGTTEEGSTAVMCKLYDSESEEVEKFSSAVDNKEFEGNFENVEAGEYTIYCANYEGGEIKNVKVTVEEQKEEEKTEEQKEEEKTEEKAEETEPKEKTYTEKVGNFELQFTDEEGHTFTANIVDILSLSKEELDKIVSEKEYNETMDTLNKNLKDEGKILGIYVIEVEDEDGVAKTEGTLKIKIKLTDDLKKYTSFKLVNVDEENGYAKGDVVKLTVEGDYLVGELPHLSVYVLVGEEKTTNNPSTADTITTSVALLTISLIGLGTTRILKKEQ